MKITNPITVELAAVELQNNGQSDKAAELRQRGYFSVNCGRLRTKSANEKDRELGLCLIRRDHAVKGGADQETARIDHIDETAKKYGVNAPTVAAHENKNVNRAAKKVREELASYKLAYDDVVMIGTSSDEAYRTHIKPIASKYDLDGKTIAEGRDKEVNRIVNRLREVREERL